VLIRRVAGKAYSDPDIVSMIDDSGGLLDPRSLVQFRVRSLLHALKQFDGTLDDPFQRICGLASLAGFEVSAMSNLQRECEMHDAILVYLSGNSKKGTIFYNPEKSKGRIIFSIAHEITHSFFPTTGTGARFRSMCREDSREAQELERLCDLGASELTLPQGRFERVVARVGFGIGSVDGIAKEFGTSFEATLYRMASAADFPAAAGLARFRFRKGEEPREDTRRTLDLFRREKAKQDGTPKPKYRRQSFHYSASFPMEYVIPWNKSFPVTSCIYRAAKTRQIEEGVELIPIGKAERQMMSELQALRAPYQRPEATAEWPDVLFLLRPHRP